MLLKIIVKKKSAAPSFNPAVSEEINKNAKQQIKELHTDFPDIDKKLFRDLENKRILKIQ